MDCMELMAEMPDSFIDFTLTDIPYDAANRDDNGLRNLDKGFADVMQFNLDNFLREVNRVTRNSLCIFCGKEQFSQIYEYFASQKGTVRPIIWEKSNPSPMNGQYIYLSGVEMAVWFKKSGTKTFNAHCKNTVFKYPNGRAKFHPTEKNHKLLKDILLDNTNEGDVVFDPCAGSGAHCLVAAQNGRQFFGAEIDTTFCDIANKRIQDVVDRTV
jgi:site-specific DNA-methyltransferase (adenine-specific)